MKNFSPIKIIQTFTLLLSLFSLATFSFSQTTQAFTASGSFTVPCGVTSITVGVYGAGGGGGGSNTGGQAAGGGGGGGFVDAVFAVLPGQVYPFTVGLGGNGGVPTNSGQTGQASNFDGVLVAFGGTGGQRGSDGGAGGFGGSGSGWAGPIPGSDGNAGGTDIGGFGGANNGPSGGAGGIGGPPGINGSVGGAYGAGGGGGGDRNAGTSTNGGNGANGAIVITYTSTVTQADAGPDQNLCGITNVSGNAPDAGWTATWTVISGPVSVTSPNNPNSAVTGITPGSCSTIEWRFTMAGCPDIVDQVVLCQPMICNDDPCGAMPLTVATTGCSYTQYSNTGATASNGMVEPGCANYDDNDVWFSAVVPANGQINIRAVDNGAPGNVYPGIAVYEGTCNNLVHAGCDYTVSTVTPSDLSYNGVPGTTVYIRVWDYFDTENGFGLCLFTNTNPTGNVLPGPTTVTCGTPMTFMDPGGTGNYMTNSSATYIICPDTPGQFVTIDFSTGPNFFDLENGWDRLTFLDGSGTNSPIIGQYTGTTIPATITSSAADGCLTVQFQSDNIITDFGWLATVSCTAVAGINSHLCSSTNCSGNCGQWICADGMYPTGNNGNSVEDLGMQNSGCFGTSGEIASHWFYFTTLTDGTIEFTFDGPNGQDYDFAVWGPTNNGEPACPLNTGAGPILCSYAAVGNTGNPVGISQALGGGESFEGAEGDGWVDALNVSAGETYAMILNIFMNGNPQPVIDLTIGGTGTLDCTPVLLPISLISFDGINQGDKNLLSWITETEMNNDFFTIESSINGFEWNIVGHTDGAGNSQSRMYYTMYDYNPNFPVTYYRLKQTDMDGEFDYSKTIAVNTRRSEDDDFISSLFPNPGNSYSTFTYNGKNNKDPLKVQIVDKFGAIVMNNTYLNVFEGMPTTIQTADLAQGIYQVIFSQGNNLSTQRLAIIR